MEPQKIGEKALAVAQEHTKFEFTPCDQIICYKSSNEASYRILSCNRWELLYKITSKAEGVL